MVKARSGNHPQNSGGAHHPRNPRRLCETRSNKLQRTKRTSAVPRTADERYPNGLLILRVTLLTVNLHAPGRHSSSPDESRSEAASLATANGYPRDTRKRTNLT